MKYSINYEGGKCPVGYEYVNGFFDVATRKWHDAYCRKIKKQRTGINSMEKRKEREERKIRNETIKALSQNREEIYKEHDL